MPRGIPTELKLLRGTVRPSRVLQRTLTGDSTVGEPPNCLSEGAKVVWQSVAPAIPPGTAHRSYGIGCVQPDRP